MQPGLELAKLGRRQLGRQVTQHATNSVLGLRMAEVGSPLNGLDQFIDHVHGAHFSNFGGDKR
jgi:hypothetical protein